MTFLVYTYFLCMLCYNRFLNHWIILALSIFNCFLFWFSKGNFPWGFRNKEVFTPCEQLIRPEGQMISAFIPCCTLARTRENPRKLLQERVYPKPDLTFCRKFIAAPAIEAKISPWPFFSETPRTFRARKPICQTAIHLFSKADLLTCF